jgi:branched-chain amino acid transport system ATP-binding protein
VTAALLEVNDLTVRYGRTVAVNNVSLKVAAGELVGLIGPNGAGKTTLFDAVSGFANVSSGSVRFAGRDITRLRVHQRARMGLRRTFQGAELFDDLTVWENLRVSSARGTDVLDIARTTGVRQWAGVEAAAVPTGVRRRVDLARVLAAKPRMVLLDEPGAGLEAEDKRALAETLRRLAAEDMAILIVDHDMELIADACQRVHVLNLGELLASGTVTEIRQNPHVIEAYLGAS